MSGRQVKEVRGQLRIISKEILPEVMTEELFKTLQKHIDTRLDKLEGVVRTALEGMSTRQKDAQDFLVRQLTSMTTQPDVVAVDAPTPTPPPSDQL